MGFHSLCWNIYCCNCLSCLLLLFWRILPNNPQEVQVVACACVVLTCLRKALFYIYIYIQIYITPNVNTLYIKTLRRPNNSENNICFLKISLNTLINVSCVKCEGGSLFESCCIYKFIPLFFFFALALVENWKNVFIVYFCHLVEFSLGHRVSYITTVFFILCSI